MHSDWMSFVLDIICMGSYWELFPVLFLYAIAMMASIVFCCFLRDYSLCLYHNDGETNIN